uniref:Uncharacterized protein n=1 Tax=viral metagenome TaxID=1070528 RepID=A0A6C0LCY4_9ZZZZ
MNDMLINIITNIIYIVAVLIVVILILALINYTLYTIYSIKEIIVHNTSEYAIHYKLKDIYNYKLINYVNIINTDNNYKYDISSEFNAAFVIDMKEFTLTKHIIDITKPSPKYIDLSYLKDYVDKDKIEDNKVHFKLKNIDALKLEDFMILYEVIYLPDAQTEVALALDNTKLIAKYKNGDNTSYYSIEYNKKSYSEYSINNTVDININKSLYGDIVSFTALQDKKKKIIARDGIIILYIDDSKSSNNIDTVKVNNNTDIYGYILNGLFLLIPTTLLWSNDKYAAGLYVKTNNNLYEIILLLVFLIIFIILIALIYDFYTYIFNIASNSKIADELFITKIMNRNIHLVVITLCIIIYCIIHSLVYFFAFISGTYKKIKAMYGDLIVADEYIRNETNKHLISNNYNSDAILEAFNDIAYGGDISYVAGKYNVIDGTTNQDIYDVKNKFEEKMIAINYCFNYDENIYNTNKYTNTFFTKMKNILLYSKYQIEYTGTADINKTLLLVLIIYLYFVKNNIDDPYILIKLNKLIFGRVANIGIPEIDEEIHNTLTLRSLQGHNLENKAIIDDLEYEKKQIFDNIKNNEKDAVITKIEGYKGGDTGVDNNVLNFSNKLYVELDYWGAVYFFNLYLALEIMIGCLVILACLFIIKYTDNDMKENVERYIDKMKELIETIVEEIKTAVLGVV